MSAPPTASEKIERCGIFDSDAVALERMKIAEKRNKRKAKRKAGERDAGAESVP